jgi:3D (Asp-Asp-Asp) domain-containing protein
MQTISIDQQPSKSTVRLNRAMLVLNRLRVSALFLAYAPQELFSNLRVMTLSRLSSPRRRALMAVLAMMVAVPTTLFVKEHSLRTTKEAELRYLSASVLSENCALKNTLRDLFFERMQLRRMLLDAGFQVRTPREVHMKVVATGYSSSVNETDSTPHLTASNTLTRRGIIALSRDLLRQYTHDAPFSFGDRVWLDGLGEFIVEDSMNFRWRRRADIWFPSRDDAIRFGSREIYLSKISPDISAPATQMPY